MSIDSSSNQLTSVNIYCVHVSKIINLISNGNSYSDSFNNYYYVLSNRIMKKVSDNGE